MFGKRKESWKVRGTEEEAKEDEKEEEEENMAPKEEA